MLRCLLPALVLLSGCTMTAEQSARADAVQAREDARLSKALAGRSPGKPTDCIDPRSLNATVYGDKILYQFSTGRAWLTQTSGGCFGLTRDDIIVTKSFTGQLCRGDIVRTVDRTSGFPSGSCTFGEFMPYERPRR